MAMTEAQQAALDQVNARAAVLAEIDAKLQAANQNESVMPGMTGDRQLLPMVGQSLLKGAAGLGDMVVGLPEDVKRLYEYFSTKGAPVPQKYQPITDIAKERGYIVPENEPGSNPILKGIDFTAQLAGGGGINPYTIGRAALTSGLPAVVRNVGGQLARTGAQGAVGSAALQGMQSVGFDNPAVLGLGTMLPMGITGAAMSLRPSTATIANEALKGATPEQLRLAQALQNQSFGAGAPVTAAEAISQTTGGNPLSNIQRIVESSPKGAAVMSPFMAARPAGNAQYFARTVDEISPIQGGLEIPERMQVVAKESIDAARKEGNVLAEPFYKASERQLVDNSTMVSLMSDPAIEKAVTAVMKDPFYRVTNANPNSIQVFDAAKKYLNDKSSEFARAGNNNASDVASSAARTITSNIDVISPAYQRARGIVQQNMTDVVEPMQKLPLGKIAETVGYGEDIAGAQRNVLMPTNPKALTPTEISKTVQILKSKDPNIVQDWTRQNLEGIFNENSQNLQSGANQAGGAKFITNITGNAQQKENLKALISEGVSPAAWKGFDNFAEVMEAQGKRQGQGSLTASNIEAQKELKGGGIGVIPKSIFKPSTVTGWYEDWRLGKNTQELARLLTNPEGVKLFVELSKTKPQSAKAQALANTLAGGNVATNPLEKEEK